MSKFKLTQTAAEVQNILNNSLQKPTGLTKTKLVGVGVNGQENIEIGDNLTLANGKLSSAAGGGGGGEEKPLYRHHIKIYAAGRINVVFEIFNNRSEQYDISSLMAYINSGARDITCSGCVYYESE